MLLTLTNSLTGTGTATTAGGLEAVLEEVGPVGVRGARVEIGFRVVVRALVLVGDGQSDGGA